MCPGEVQTEPPGSLESNTLCSALRWPSNLRDQGISKGPGLETSAEEQWVAGRRSMHGGGFRWGVIHGYPPFLFQLTCRWRLSGRHRSLFVHDRRSTAHLEPCRIARPIQTGCLSFYNLCTVPLRTVWGKRVAQLLNLRYSMFIL